MKRSIQDYLARQPKYKGYRHNAGAGTTVQNINSISGTARFLLGMTFIINDANPLSSLSNIRASVKINSALVIEDAPLLYLSTQSNTKGNAPFAVLNYLLSGSDSIQITYNNGTAVNQVIDATFAYLEAEPEPSHV